MKFAPILTDGAQRTVNARTGRSRRRRLAVQLLESRRVLASFAVTTATDVVDETDGLVSLREAITSANSTAATDTITFDAAVFASATEIDLIFGELPVSHPVEIIGPGRDLLTVDAQNASRVLNITAVSGDVTIQGITLTGGRTSEDNGELDTLQSGGGIRFVTDGTLTIRDSTISGNQTAGASADGGGLFADRGTVHLSNTVITSNLTSGRSARGGGLFVTNASLQIDRTEISANSTSAFSSDGGGVFASIGTVEITESVISGNRAASGGAYGGGLYLSLNTTTIARSTVSGNFADGFSSTGGGIALDGNLNLINSTVSGNAATGSGGSGGGISVIEGELQLIHSTVTGNSATQGTSGGIIVMNNPDSRLTVLNSIVATNTDSGTAPDFMPPSDAAKLFVRGSLIGDNTGTTLAESQTVNGFGNIVGAPSPGGGVIDPMLAALGNNGGPTPTHLPIAGSPAIDAGDNTFSVDPQDDALTSDHRGLPFIRNSGGTVDMGAVEVQPAPAPLIAWEPPQAILIGTELSDQQLNATAQIPGTFVYTPAAGTILDAGEDQVLIVQFTPDDAVNYTNGGATVTIDVVPPLEFGDAPASYATLKANDGARHESGLLRLGATVDLEADGQPSEDADADTGDDGVRLIAPIIAHPQSPTTTSFVVNVSAVSQLDGWIDFDGSGTFDHPSEHIGGGSSVDLVIRDNIVSVNVPAGSVAGETFARFRVSSSGGLLPTGLATDGEVEDFAVTIIDGSTPQDIALALPSGAVSLAADADDLTISSAAKELFRAPTSSITRYDITGAESSDVLIIDHNNGDPIPSGGMSYDGGDRVNTVRVIGDKSELDVSTGGNVTLSKINVVDLGVSDAVTFIVDRIAMDSIDPDGVDTLRLSMTFPSSSP